MNFTTARRAPLTSTILRQLGPLGAQRPATIGTIAGATTRPGTIGPLVGGARRSAPIAAITGHRYAAGIVVDWMQAPLLGLVPRELAAAGFEGAQVFERGQQPAGVGATHEADGAWTHVVIARWTGASGPQSLPDGAPVRWVEDLDAGAAPPVPAPGGGLPPLGDVPGLPEPGIAGAPLVKLAKGQRYILGLLGAAPGADLAAAAAQLVDVEVIDDAPPMSAECPILLPEGASTTGITGTALADRTIQTPAPLAGGAVLMWACPMPKAQLIPGVPTWVLVAGGLAIGGLVAWKVAT